MEEKKYGVWAVRSAASMFGAAEAWCKADGVPMEFDSLNAARLYGKYEKHRWNLYTGGYT